MNIDEGKETYITDIYGHRIKAYQVGPTDGPYLEYLIKEKRYNPNYGDDKMCVCGHPYIRHFDSYEDNFPVGCKYCECDEFKPAEDQK